VKKTPARSAKPTVPAPLLAPTSTEAHHPLTAPPTAEPHALASWTPGETTHHETSHNSEPSAAIAPPAAAVREL
jgi:hypothetical protein